MSPTSTLSRIYPFAGLSLVLFQFGEVERGIAAEPASTNNLPRAITTWENPAFRGKFDAGRGSSYQTAYATLLNDIQNGQTALATNTITLDTPCTAKEVLWMAALMNHDGHKIPSLMPLLSSAYPSSKAAQFLTDTTLEGGAYNLMLTLRTNEALLPELHRIVGPELEYCRPSSILFAASYLLLSPHATNLPPQGVTISIVNGITTHESAPRGLGHQWIIVGDTLYDPANPTHDGKPTATTRSDQRFVPVNAFTFAIDPRTKRAAPPTHTLYLDTNMLPSGGN
jgi:hypothetical protein